LEDILTPSKKIYDRIFIFIPVQFTEFLFLSPSAVYRSFFFVVNNNDEELAMQSIVI